MRNENFPQENYPQDVTDLEKSLGFEPIQLGGYGLPNQSILHLSDAPVIARRLSSSDVLVKIQYFGDICYTHKRFARSLAAPEARPQWFPINDPNISPQDALLKFERGISNAPHINEITGCPYRFSPIPQK